MAQGRGGTVRVHAVAGAAPRRQRSCRAACRACGPRTRSGTARCASRRASRCRASTARTRRWGARPRGGVREGSGGGSEHASAARAPRQRLLCGADRRTPRCVHPAVGNVFTGVLEQLRVFRVGESDLRKPTHRPAIGSAMDGSRQARRAAAVPASRCSSSISRTLPILPRVVARSMISCGSSGEAACTPWALVSPLATSVDLT